MNDSVNRLFSFDTGIYNWAEIIEDRQIAPSKSKIADKEDEDNAFLSMALSQASIQSLNNEIEDIIHSIIDDMDGLKTTLYATLTDNARIAIESSIKHIDDTNIRDSLSELTNLLSENLDLASLFQSYTSWIQKA
jgi:hypothetical protein